MLVGLHTWVEVQIEHWWLLCGKKDNERGIAMFKTNRIYRGSDVRDVLVHQDLGRHK